MAAVLPGSEHKEAEKPRGSLACDVIEVSDDEEGAAGDANRGRSPGEGVLAVPTPRKRAMRSVTGESEDEGDAEGGGGSSKEYSVGLEDDGVLASPRGKRRAAARVVTSDSEGEDVSDGGLGSGKDDGGLQEEGVKAGKKRGFCRICDSEDEDAIEGVDVVTSKAASPSQIQSGEDEDDMVPVCQVLKKMRKERVSDDDDDDDDEFGEAKGCSTPPTRRSARLVKNQSKGGRAARRVLNFVEPKEYEGSEDDVEEDDDMEEFINDEDSSENTSDSAEESCDKPDASGTSVLNEGSPAPEESDSEVDYADVMARIGRKNKAKDWKFEGDMLAAFDDHPEICLKAVCALYRKQTEEEQKQKATFVHNKQGFNQIHALRYVNMHLICTSYLVDLLAVSLLVKRSKGVALDAT